MARMVPIFSEIELANVKSPAERKIYRKMCAELPEPFVIIHSLELLIKHETAPPEDAEADFVVFDPSQGFVVIEVKGGGITYDGSTRKWHSTDRHGVAHEISDPFQQSRNAKYQILRNLKASKDWGISGMPRIVVGHAVLFPDLLDTGPLTGPERPLELIGNNSSVAALGTWVQSVFAYWSRGMSSCLGLGAKGMRIVDTVFAKSVEIHTPLALTIEREFRRQIELTTRQSRVLRSLKHRHRAVIAGGAGTGKTVIAVEHAKSLASQGLRTLLVCYNRALADFLKRQVEGIQNIQAMSFHQLCHWRIKCVRSQQGIDLVEEAKLSYPGQSLYDVQLPYALARSCESDDFRYDAVVVDEAQDFGEEYWMPIEMLLHDEENSPFFIFTDPNQSVYRPVSTFPILGAPFLLTENCRNTNEIHKVAYTYYIGDDVDPPGLEGAPPEIIEAVSPEQQAKKIKALVSNLIQIEQVSPQDIAVLVFDDAKEAFYEALAHVGPPAGARWSFEALWVPSTVLVDTARRFKGLEAGIVILCGVEQASHERDTELLYVSLSRARSRLFLIGSIGKAKLLLNS